MLDWNRTVVKVQHQCPWCGLDRRHGEHAVQVDRDDGGVDIRCTITVQTFHPARLCVIGSLVERSDSEAEPAKGPPLHTGS